MEDQAFYSLKNSLMRLKKERDEITTDLLRDKQNLNQVDSNMRKIKAELDFRINELKEKENNINDYDQVLKESENTLQRVFILLFICDSYFYFLSWLKHRINWLRLWILKAAFYGKKSTKINKIHCLTIILNFKHGFFVQFKGNSYFYFLRFFIFFNFISLISIKQNKNYYFYFILNNLITFPIKK